jgi:hypothetical protein
MTESAVTPQINEDFLAFLRGDVTVRETLPRQLHAKLLSLARSTGRDLALDQLEEVTDEVWVLVLSGRGSGFDSQRGDVFAFLHELVRDAVRRVRASYAPPGCRTRLPSRKERDKDPDNHWRSRRITARVDDLPDRSLPRIDGRAAEHRVELGLMVARYGESLVEALHSIHVEGESVSAAARKLGLSRFQLHRALMEVREDAEYNQVAVAA